MKRRLAVLPLTLGLFLTGCNTGSADLDPPTIALTASPTTLSAPGSVKLSARATDSSGIASVKFYRNGTLLGLGTADADGLYTFTDTVSSGGNYRYTAVATDASSDANTATSAAVSVTATFSGGGGTGGTDTTAPTISLAASPTNLKAAGDVVLTATVSDNVGVVSVEFYRGSTRIGGSTVNGSVATFTDTVSASGSYTYTAVAKDAAGNSKTSNAVTVTATISGTGAGIGAGSSSKVQSAAEAFLATLSDTQKASVVLPYTSTTATKWSGLPTSSVTRQGLSLASLTTAQRDAALSVIRAALSGMAGEGFDEEEQIRMAQDVLALSQSGPSSAQYFIAFLGTPGGTGPWQLQFSGRDLALNHTYGVSSGTSVVTGVTPSFRGAEPLCWTVTGSTSTPNTCTAPSTSTAATSYAPLSHEQQAFAALLASLSSSQQTSAKLSQTFTDIVLGPGQDGRFPATKAGLAVSTLSAEQKALVLAALRPWVQDADEATAAALLSIYESELGNTFIAFSGTPTLTSSGDYVRIDGPSVWVEFTCQSSAVYSGKLRCSGVWRDHLRDYGGNFTF